MNFVQMNLLETVYLTRKQLNRSSNPSRTSSPRPLARGLQKILIHRALDFVEPSPIIGFRFGGVFLFFGFHVLAFYVKRLSICCKDTSHGWPDESTGRFHMQTVHKQSR